MKKALIVTTVSGFVPQFEMNNVKLLQELGYEVHYASNFKNPHYGPDNRRLEGTGIICHQVDFVRSPFRLLRNIRAYTQLCKLMRKVPFALIHCHTPMGGVLGRVAAEKVRREDGKRKSQGQRRLGGYARAMPARVVYTAHGFHFYQGAPFFNWLLYYPAERMLARVTDTLITINEEDYRRAKSFRLRGNDRGKGVVRVHGAGIDLGGYYGITAGKERKRREMGIKKEDTILLSVGELSKRKNHKAVIKALISMEAEKDAQNKKRKPGAGPGHLPAYHYLIAGEGRERGHLERLIQKGGLAKEVSLLGYRTDIRELLAISDCFVFPSRQEGMPVALLEAVAAGVPCIASDIRGNRELLREEALFGLTDKKGLQKKLWLAGKPSGLRRPCRAGLNAYDISNISRKMRKVYAHRAQP